MDFPAFDREIRSLMTKDCGIVRNGAALQNGVSRLEQIETVLDQVEPASETAVTTCHKALVAKEVLKAALARKQSLGAHYRSDEAEQGGKENGTSL